MVSTATGSGMNHDCPDGEFVTDISPTGMLTCAPLGESIKASVNSACSVYFGWRDGCDGCGLIPTKWGRAGGSTCTNGVGANNTCSTFSLGGASVAMFGLNTPGDVDENDTVYSGLHCAAGVADKSSGPCGPGQFVVDRSDGGLTCQTVDAAVLSYVRSSCSLYMGWRDSCTNCALAPTKWGRTSPGSCDSGIGGGNTCSVQTLGTDQVDLLGLDLDGDMNADDKLHIGLSCVPPPEPVITNAMGTCPEGEFVTGTNGNGSRDCVRPDAVVSAYFKEHCTIYLGWVDGCTACTTLPTKWGQVRDGFCANGIGVNDTCAVAPLGGAMVNLFGLNTAGNVNDDDKFYMGFTCN